MPEIPKASDFGPRPNVQPQRAIVGMTDDVAVPAAEIGNQMVQAGERMFTRQDAVSRATIKREFLTRADEQLRRMETEDDLSDPASVQRYGAFLAQTRDELLANHKGSADSRAALFSNIEDLRANYAGEIAGRSTIAQRKLVTDTLGKSIQPIVSAGYDDPDGYEERQAAIEAEIREMSGALTPEEERAALDGAYSQNAVATLEGMLDRGDITRANEFLGRLDVQTSLTPAEQRLVQKRIAAQTVAEDKARQAGRMALITAAETAGVAVDDLPQAVRWQLAGISLPDDPIAKVQRVISAMEAGGYQVSPQQRAQMIAKANGMAIDAAGGASSPQGKVIEDRQRFISQYGPDSPQVQAFDELSRTGGEPASLSDVAGMRKEFTGLSKDFVQVRDSYARIQAAAESPDAAGDLALIFNYMKILDPGSVVREGEFATAQNASGVPTRIRNWYNNVQSGERLSEDQRVQFVDRAGDLFQAQLSAQARLEQQFGTIAQRNGINPSDVIVDFKSGAGSAVAGSPPPDSETAAQATPPETVIEYGIDGLPIASTGGGANAED